MRGRESTSVRLSKCEWLRTDYFVGKEADFYVLKHTKAPALLLEIGFIDNSIDNELFDRKFEWIAEGIAKAILDVAGGGVVKKGNTCPSCGQVMN